MNLITLIPQKHKPYTKKNILLKLTFSSVFNPSCISNLRILSRTGVLSGSSQFKFKKMLVKQSYLLMLWLKTINLRKPKIIYLPRKGNLEFSKTKSPMAQKTFSQEQFKFQVYRFAFSNIYLKTSKNPVGLCAEKILTLSLFLRANTFLSGTNLFFLDKSSLILPVSLLSLLQLI